jgi:hypothetical protein
MTARYLLSRLILPLALLAVLAGILSCAPVETGPRAWIDFPLDGSKYFPDTTVTVTCHAFAREGVAEVQLAVNGQAYRIGQPAQPGEQFVEIEMEWLATEPGDYLLSVTAFSMAGETSNPAHVTVTVVGKVPEFLLTPTEIRTEVPLTETPVAPTTAPPAPTGTPRPPIATPPPPTGTARPPTATPPPPPPNIVSFTANPPSIDAGQCSRLSWAVEGAISAVYLDTEGVSDHDSRDRCPTTTTTYTLRAVGPGGERTANATVEVTRPSPTPIPPSPTPIPDTQGPPAPSLVSPTGGQGVGCGDVTLRWNPVSDPSGIGMYYVKVEKVTGSYKSGAWNTTATQLVIPVAWFECGQSYRWSVAAEDGLGNMGPWSEWGEFTVTVT